MSTTVIGSLTRDPEIKFVGNDKAVVKFSVAVNKRRKEEEVVSYFDCEAWGSLAENIATSLRKGDRIIAWGELKQDRFEVQGQKRSAVILVADAVGTELRFATATPEKKGNGPRPASNPNEDAF